MSIALALLALIGGLLLFILLRKRLLKSREEQEEWLPVVDEKGKVIGKAPRRKCHSKSKLLHPVVHIHIVDTDGNIFLQQRGHKKKLLPGKWDTAVGGHVTHGETVEQALRREAQEELGINKLTVRFLGSYIWETQREKELVYSFTCHIYDRISVNTAEVETGRFWHKEEIEDPANESVFTPNFLHEYYQLVRNNRKKGVS